MFSLTGTRCGEDKMVLILQKTFSIFFQYENCWIVIEISLKYVPKVQINNNSASH